MFRYTSAPHAGHPAVPHAQAVDVSNTGHMVAGDDNDAFTTAVLAFLDRIPPIPQPRQAPDQ